MNRVFKTKWSVAHQEYVVTDEKHASKTKAAKSVVALAVARQCLSLNRLADFRRESRNSSGKTQMSK